MKLKYDLHIHSCLSPCGDKDMTPWNIVNMAKLAGLELIALTDHNSTRNCPAFLKAAEVAGLLALPGMELNTREEAHVLCLLPDLNAAEALNSYVYNRLPFIKNNPSIFGEQYIMDEADRITAEEDKLLINAADIGIYEVAELLDSYGGVAIPAHIDRAAFSVLSNLGIMDRAMGFKAAEVTRNCNINKIIESHRELEGLSFIINSDAHSLTEIYGTQYDIETAHLSGKAVINAIKSFRFNI